MLDIYTIVKQFSDTLLHTQNHFFFNEINLFGNIRSTYETIAIDVDMNIGSSEQKIDSNNYLPDLWDTSSIKHLISGKTCIKSA